MLRMSEPSPPSLLARLSSLLLREPTDREQLIELLRSAYTRNLIDADVLSFPYGPRQGDIVLCHPVIAREARAQRKALAAHYAHLVIHGMLHLRGHDHAKRRQARRMERAEIRILRRLGFADPYALE